MSSAPSASPARGDAWLSAGLCGVFATMTAVASTYPPTARAMPVLVGVCGTVLCVVQFALTVIRLRRRSAANESNGFPREHLVMFAWFVAANMLVALFGILAGGALFVAAFLRLRSAESLASSILAGLTLSAVLHLLLERGLGVHLFAGVIWQ